VSRACHNLLQSGRSRRQGAVLRVHIGPHGERRIGVTEPRGDDCDRDSLRVHDAGTGMPRIVQPDLPHLGRAAQLPPEVAERVGVIRTPGVVDNDVLSLADVVRAEPQPLSGLKRLGALERLSQRLAKSDCR
jgi:hypothetical protein